MQKRRVRRHEVIQPQDQSIRLIPLTQGQNAIVDANDYDWLTQWNWYAVWCKGTSSFYAYRSLKDGIPLKPVLMHQFIFGNSAIAVDHRNHDTLDNRRSNLRPCTNSENAANQRKRSDNTSGHKGVVWDSARSKWRAQASINGKVINLGRYDSIDDAKEAYRNFAVQHFGEFAHFN